MKLRETAGEVVDVVWGRKAVGLRDKIVSWFFGPVDTEGRPAVHARVVKERLTKLGFTPDQINEIRDLATKAMKASIDRAVKAGKVPEKYTNASQDSFPVYQLYLNVGPKETKEVMGAAEKVFKMKLEKAGIKIPVKEGWDDYDEDDDVRTADREIAKQKKAGGASAKAWDAAEKSAKKVNADKDLSRLARKEQPKSDNEDDAVDVKPAKAKPAVKTETKPEETKTAARGDKVAGARKFMQDNPDAKRKDFVAFMSKYGVGGAYANTMFYGLKKKLAEVFFITNDEGEVLAEGDVWTVFEDYSKRLMMFKSEWNAKKKSMKTGGKVKSLTV